MNGRLLAGAMSLSVLLAACASPLEYAGLGAGVTAALGRMPSHEIQQVYYVGVLDARNEQIPPAIYRITVRGQSSFISATRFASGWVPAALVDSLGTRMSFTSDGDLEITGNDETENAKLTTGRGLMMFGPEGFRRAPRDHRLVLVMASDPSEYFQAIEETLGQIATAQQQSRDRKSVV